MGFSLLRVSEKRYKAEAEVEALKVTLSEREAYIEELERQMEEFRNENSQLK